MKKNYFNLNDLRQVTDDYNAKTLAAALKRKIGCKSLMAECKTTNRGKETTQLMSMNHYNLDEAIKFYSTKHELQSVNKSRASKLKILMKLKKEEN